MNDYMRALHQRFFQEPDCTEIRRELEALKACARVRAAGLDIVAVCCILDREEGGREKLKEAGYELHSLFTRKELVEMARA